MKKSKCNRGHLLTKDNLIINRKGRQCKKCHRVTQQRYRKTQQGVWTSKSREIRDSGWTLERYQDFLCVQDNACAICKTPFEQFTRNPSCDHDHACMTPRGLLCDACNLGIGKFKENPLLLELAAQYLKKWKVYDVRT